MLYRALYKSFILLYYYIIHQRFLMLTVLGPMVYLSPCPFDVFSVVQLQVFFSLPLFLFPGGFHLIATIGMEFGCILQMCHIHIHFFFLITFEREDVFVLLYSSPFGMVCDQTMLRIFYWECTFFSESPSQGGESLQWQMS